jgi:hypothetical protein
MSLFLYIDSRFKQLFKIIEDIIKRAHRSVVVRNMIVEHLALIIPEQYKNI